MYNKEKKHTRSGTMGFFFKRRKERSILVRSIKIKVCTLEESLNYI